MMNFTKLNPTKNKIFLIISIVPLLLTGCAYHGTLKKGFYSPQESSIKLPFKANLVCGVHFKTIEVSVDNIYFSHSTHIKTDPALQDALTETCESLFKQVFVTTKIDPSNQLGADILLLPTLEIREHILELKISVKNPTSGEVLQQYTSSGNFRVKVPGSVHAITTANICLTAGLASPIVAPIITKTLGRQAEADLEKRVSYCLGQIAEDIRNDPALVVKAKALRH